MVRPGRLRSRLSTLDALANDDWLVVATHDCDLYSPDIGKEPTVEFVVASALGSGADGNYTNAKNPRRLDVQADFAGSGVSISLNAAKRATARRTALAGLAPDGSLADEQVTLLSKWLGRRYDRAAFPDNLNDRLRPVLDSIERELRVDGSQLMGLYVNLSSHDELPDNETYEITLVGVVREGITEASLLDVRQAVDRIGAHMTRCDGVDVLDSSVRSERGMTLEDLRYFQRWEADHISYRANTPDSLSPRT